VERWLSQILALRETQRLKIVLLVKRVINDVGGERASAVNARGSRPEDRPMGPPPNRNATLSMPIITIRHIMPHP
jgi:hypothetical protein